jgi:hypothetical protein
VTIDVGEHRRVNAEDADGHAKIAPRAGRPDPPVERAPPPLGETADKASGSVRLLWELFGEDPTRALRRYAFAGDSGNDAACFAAFTSTFGVANVRSHLAELSVPPRFVASAPMGRGFRRNCRPNRFAPPEPPPG